MGDIKYAFLCVVFICFSLVMTSIAGPVPIWGMAITAFVVRSAVIGGEGMRDGSTAPSIGCVAIRALPIEVTGRLITAVAGDAVRGSGCLMVEARRQPGCGAVAG
jgi:hypothetical protein